jgi:hypothetical protein
MEPQFAEGMKTGVGRSANRVIFTLSLALISVGAYGLFANKHSSLIFSIFAVAGLVIPVLSVFIAFPILPVANESRRAPDAAVLAGLGVRLLRPSTATEARSASTRLPSAYGLAFMFAGFLSIVESVVLFTGGIYSSPEVFTNSIIIGVTANVLVAFGFPGFHALQAAKGGYVSLIGSAFGVTAAIGGTLDLWLREDALADGIGTTPASYHSLALTVQAVGMFSAVLIAISITSAGVYPRWTAGAKCMTAFLSLVFILLDGNYGALMLTVYRLDGLLQAAALLAFSWHMLDLPAKRAA